MTNENQIKLIQTCGACPEQYDLYIGDHNIGYLRLRHGYFYAEHIPSGEVVYEAEPHGDGIFEGNEREFYLKNASDAILQKHSHYKKDYL